MHRGARRKTQLPQTAVPVGVGGVARCVGSDQSCWDISTSTDDGIPGWAQLSTPACSRSLARAAASARDGPWTTMCSMSACRHEEPAPRFRMRRENYAFLYKNRCMAYLGFRRIGRATSQTRSCDGSPRSLRRHETSGWHSALASRGIRPRHSAQPYGQRVSLTPSQRFTAAKSREGL